MPAPKEISAKPKGVMWKLNFRSDDDGEGQPR